MNGWLAVMRKELRHITRDRATLRIALMLPVFQLILFGSIDTNVKNVPTAVLDLSRTQQSRELVDRLTATGVFRLARQVDSRDELYEAIVAGDCAVGLEIPADYAGCRLRGESAEFLLLIDGSDSSVASQTLAAADGMALSRSLEELGIGGGRRGLPLIPRPQILFNPDSRSANLLIPGLVAVLMTFSGVLLSANAIVRERERGTIEQLMVTPIAASEMILGKLIPYLFLAFVQLTLVLTLMRVVFRVPIHGHVLLLAGLSLVYLTALLSLGLMLSARARNQVQATQMAQAVLLPSIMLSGYIFPLTSLHPVLRGISQVLPATHFVAISRGIIIRGAGFHDLWPQVAALAAISFVLLTASIVTFRRLRF